MGRNGKSRRVGSAWSLARERMEGRSMPKVEVRPEFGSEAAAAVVREHLGKWVEAYPEAAEALTVMIWADVMTKGTWLVGHKEFNRTLVAGEF